MLRESAEADLCFANAVDRAPGVRRRNLPDPEDYDKVVKTMSVCQLLELGLNQLNEAGSALYVLHTYNAAVARNFVGDEFSERRGVWTCGHG